MASASERQRNNVRAGVFVTIAMALAMVVIAILTDAVEGLTRSSTNYVVSFTVASGVSNLKEGSDVRIGGVRMGEVREIRPRYPEQGSAFRQIDVEISVDRHVPLYADAVVLISAPLIGAESWIDIPDVGNPSAGPPASGRLAGTPTPGALGSLIGGDNAAKTSEIIENAKLFSEFLADVPQEYEANMAPALRNLNELTSDANSIVADLRQRRWPSWADSVDQILSWALNATNKLDVAIADGQAAIAESRELVSENRPQVKSTIDNIHAASETFNRQTLAKANALLDRGQEGLDQAVGVIRTMQLDYAGWATNLGEALANANLSGQQLKLAASEIRRSPWKLLHRPSDRELEHELLYESVRAYSLAAADLKAASESVRRVLDEHPEQLAGSEEAYRRLERNLLESLANYERTQQQLLEVFVADLP